jgi:hypothetical protein
LLLPSRTLCLAGTLCLVAAGRTSIGLGIALLRRRIPLRTRLGRTRIKSWLNALFRANRVAGIGWRRLGRSPPAEFASTLICGETLSSRSVSWQFPRALSLAIPRRIGAYAKAPVFRIRSVL